MIFRKSDKEFPLMNKKVVRCDQRGFTLIELSMALLFISFIMLLLISTLLSMMRTYNKGVWLSQINQAGRQINADISGQARFSSKPNYQKDNNRLCVGGVSYIWNTNDQIEDGSFINWYSGEGATQPGQTSLRLVRVIDSNGRLCSSGGLAEMPNRNSSDVTSLLGSGVAIQEFTVNSSVHESLFGVQAVFSTEGDVKPVLHDGRWQCVEADGTFSASNSQFCAFIDLNLVVYGRSAI
jgi:prepilin-type N-terminal cleavage/methylation domain-containing protein